MLYPDAAHRELLLSEAEWALANDLFAVLKPFLDATRVLSGTKFITQSCVYPIYRRLHEFVADQAKLYDRGAPMEQLLGLMKKDLKDALLDCDDLVKKASLYDPRFLGMWRGPKMPKEELDSVCHVIRRDMAAEKKKMQEESGELPAEEKKGEAKAESKADGKEEKVLGAAAAVRRNSTAAERC